MRKYNFVLICCLVVYNLSPASAQVYKWTDKNGDVHFTDTPDNIPKSSRSKAKQIQKADTNQDNKGTHPNSVSYDPKRMRSDSYKDLSYRDAVFREFEKRNYLNQIAELSKQIAELDGECERLSKNEHIRTSKYKRQRNRAKYAKHYREYIDCSNKLQKLQMKVEELQSKVRRIEMRNRHIIWLENKKDKMRK